MKNIIILTSTYLPNPGANGLITHSLAEELMKKDYDITVISVKSDESEKDSDVIDGVKILRIPQSNYTQKLNKLRSKNDFWSKLKLILLVILRRVKNLFLILKFPNFDNKQVERISMIVDEIIKEKNISTIIAVNKPYSNISSALHLSESYKGIKFIGIFLDSLESIVKPKFLPNILYKHLIKYNYSTLINSRMTLLLPVNIRKNLENKNIKENFVFFEFPTMNIEKKSFKFDSINNQSNILSFIYAGSLEKEIRNPDLFFQTMRALEKNNIPISVNLYGKIDQYSLDKVKNDKFISYLGFIKQENLFDHYSNSDFLINISNLYLESVPSKIFELFSTGKPIINFITNDDDYSTSYFERYPLHFNFYLSKSFDTQLENLIQFISINRNKRVEEKEILKLFYEHTPEYFAALVNKYV